MSSYGVTLTGFVPKRQPDILAEINASLQVGFGAQVNLAGNTALGVTSGIYSEREALLWELAEAVYQSAFPGGAEGVSTDNVLALSSLTRNAAVATVTNPTPAIDAQGIERYGLVLFGAAGTVVPKNSIIQSDDSPPVNFKLDADTTINAAVNAVQTVVFSATPTTGGFTLAITRAADGQTFTTATIAAGSAAATVQAAIAALNDGSVYPYTDVTVSVSGNSYVLTFGGTTPATIPPPGGGSPVLQPASGAQPQPDVIATGVSLMGSPTLVVNIAVVQTTQGSPAQGIGTATCTATGPIQVLEGHLNTIGSPLTGWSGVVNQLDCVTGSNVESDTAALNRRINRLSQQGNGTPAAIISAVEGVTGVVTALCFENLTNCAVQTLTFNTAPNSGTYQLQLAQGATGPLAATASAADLQSAINAIAGYTVLVTGNALYGFAIDYNGSFGGQAQPLLSILSNTTPSTITPAFGRPGHSYEVVVQAGSDADIAAAILKSGPAGISSYGAPNAVISGSVSTGSVTLSVASTTNITAGNLVTGPGLLAGTKVVAVGSSTVTLNQASPAGQSGSYSFTNAVVTHDTQGNPHVISFSRPNQVLPYVALALLTDYYVVPGNPSSGVSTTKTFSPSSIPTIQQDIVTLGNQVPMGGLIVAQGSNGVVGAFNDVPGVLSYGIAMQLGSPPAMPASINAVPPANIRLLPEQEAFFEALNVLVSWS